MKLGFKYAFTHVYRCCAILVVSKLPIETSAGVTNSGIYGKNDHRLSFSYALDWINYFIGQPPKRGARPLIYAATATELNDPSELVPPPPNN